MGPLRYGSALGPAPRGLDDFVAVPESNPPTPARVALGSRLFHDPILSRDSSLACASCHQPGRAFSDTVAVSRGVGGRTGRRNAPSLMNRAYGASFFWDGRAASLEQAVLLPIENHDELALPLSRLVSRLARAKAYWPAFARAYPRDSISATTIARALASYLRTLRSGNAPVDRSSAGDPGALTAEQQRGRALFFGKANCSTCHLGPNFTDEQFHNTGISAGADAGRFEVTHDSADLGHFKVPTLRNVARTAPYMHDGSLRTLDDVVGFYDRGGGANPRLDPEIRPLGLDAAERRALVEFLHALTGKDRS